MLLAVLPFMALSAQCFEDFFEDRTLRVDYIFSGDSRHQQISLDELHCSEGWYGRRVNMDRLLLQGNGQLTMTDTLGRDTLYRHSSAACSRSGRRPRRPPACGAPSRMSSCCPCRARRWMSR